VGFFPQQRTVAAGGSYEASRSVQAPFAQGTYYLILQTNAWSLISEADHGNNVMVFGPIYVGNKPPTADAGGPYDVPEGGSVALSGSGGDPDGDPLTYAWDIDNDGSFETADQNPTFSATGRDGPGSQIVVLQVCDDKGACAASDTSVNITNAAPAVGAITAPLDPVQLNTTASVSANFTDPGVLDTHNAVWDWGDGSTSPGTVDETAGSGAATGSHDYTTAGVYALTLTVTDKDGGSGESVFEYVVVYDASAGFVTGAGLIDSPAGAYTPDPSLAGKATFGFVARYQQGTTAPSGATQFRFQMAGLSFSSTSYQWLVVSGPKAQFKGSGTMNGNGDYGFLLTATDGQVNGGGGVDKFRIKIWDKLTDEVIYDNQMGAGDTTDPATALVGGNIIVHDG
jgi:PKD repeat protein